MTRRLCTARYVALVAALALLVPLWSATTNGGQAEAAQPAAAVDGPQERMVAATSSLLLDPDHDAVTKNTQHDDYQAMLFYRRSDRTATANMPNITLVSHATIDRLPHVARWCRTLRGPMSISVFVRPVVDDVAAVMGAFAADECIARHADLHLVTERGHTFNASAASGADGKDMMTHYPFNVQRNAALDGCVGALALLMDIDFHLMPMPNNREVDLRRHLEAQRAKVAAWPFLADEPWVMDAALYVIPAVETVVKAMPLPDTMETLRAAVTAHTACPFYGHHCRHCHHPTNLRRFLHAKQLDPYLVDYEEGYEPYGIVNKTSLVAAPRRVAQRNCVAGSFALPRYDDVFVGRGKDKLSFLYEIAAQGRPFVVLAAPFFIVHAGRGDHPMQPGEEYLVRVLQNKKRFAEFKARVDAQYNADCGEMLLEVDDEESGNGGELDAAGIEDRGPSDL